ncbi:hypothetical protein JCM10207_007403 [Rhodosporidiobolus poonsookiae]
MQRQQHDYQQQQYNPTHPTEQPFHPPSLPSDSLAQPAPYDSFSSHNTQLRSFPGRSHSLNEGHSQHTAQGGAAGQQGGAGGMSALPTVGEENAGAQLARRNNTVSTASSRLVRLERTRARLALQGAGLSEEDQNFYVPPSPARGGPYAINAPWSDLGHGASSSSLPLSTIAASTAGSSGGPSPGVLSPTAGAFDQPSVQAGVEAAWRRAEQEQGLGQGQRGAPVQQVQQQQQPAAAEPKRSSFVVLRGGKGDAALTERRPLQQQGEAAQSISPPPVQSQAQQQQQHQAGAGDVSLKKKNSLRPFLEQEREQQGGKEEEDWERGLKDERASGAGAGGGEDEWEAAQADWRTQDPYAALATPPMSSSFPTQLSSPFSSTSTPHSRSHTLNSHQARRGNTTDPWLPPSAAPPANQDDDPNLIRRHQSLTSFRQREPSIEQAMGVLSSSPASSSWADHSGSFDEHPSSSGAGGPNRAYGTLGLGAASSITGFGSRTRSGTSPAPLTLHHSHSLGHGSVPHTHHGPLTAGGSLSHSNSLSSQHGGAGGSGSTLTGATGLHHSNSLSSRSDSGVGGRALKSPVMNSLPGHKSPWSPTEEETKQLGGAFVAGAGPAGGSGTLSRGGSGSSRGSHNQHAHGGAAAAEAYASLAAGVNGRFAEEVRRLDEQMGGMQLGFDADGRAPSTSPQPLLPATSAAGPGPGVAGRRLPPLMTGPDVLLAAAANRQGPASAAAYVPPIGHSHFAPGANGLDGISENGAGGFMPPLPPSSNDFAPPPPQLAALQAQQGQGGMGGGAMNGFLPGQPGVAGSSGFVDHPLPPPTSLGPLRGNLTAMPGAPSSLEWARQKELLLGATPTAAGPLPFSSANAAPSSAATIVPGPFSSAPIPGGSDNWNAAAAAAAGATANQVDLAVLQQQLQMQHQQQQIHALQSQMAKALSAMDAMRAQGAVLPPDFSLAQAVAQGGSVAQAAAQAVAETPVDVNSLVQKKGYNPAVFDLRPKNARFFVIKSYTEEDVHKSLKYEIWASTDLGNKRLDRAFRESADKGPIYLFFSVNASGHFAGMAQMLTPVDYSMSSNVWASDKWKGVLKVRWIYIKDVPLSALRHIRLSNTPENKPVTSSRDTQEVPYDAGLEVLRIIASYQSRTSLLQDYAWYEASSRLQQAQQAAAAGGDPNGVPQPFADVPLYQPGQHYHPHGHPNQQQQQQQHPPPQSTPSPQPPVLSPPHSAQPPRESSPNPQPRHAQAGGRRFWNRGSGGANGAQAGPPGGARGPQPGGALPGQGLPPQQQGQGYYAPPSHQQHQVVNNGVAY